RDPHDTSIGKGGFVSRAKGLEPVQQMADGHHACGWRELLAGFAELAAQPGEIEKLHPPTSPKGKYSTMMPGSTRTKVSGSWITPWANRIEPRGQATAIGSPAPLRSRRTGKNSGSRESLRRPKPTPKR